MYMSLHFHPRVRALRSQLTARFMASLDVAMNAVDTWLYTRSGLQPLCPRLVYDVPQDDDFNALGNNPALWDPYRAPGSVQGGIASRQEFLGTFWPWFKAATLLLKVCRIRTSRFIGTIVMGYSTVLSRPPVQDTPATSCTANAFRIHFA